MPDGTTQTKISALFYVILTTPMLFTKKWVMFIEKTVPNIVVFKHQKAKQMIKRLDLKGSRRKNLPKLPEFDRKENI